MSSASAPEGTTTNRSGINATTTGVNLTERPVGRVGKYRVLSELGRGGMANVYLAVARGPGGVNKLVVLKALLPEQASEPDALAMFLDEARLAAQLNHANVVQTYEVGTEGDRHVMVMEYLEGQSLSVVLKRAEAVGKPVSLEMQIRIMILVLEGLHYAHELTAYDGAPLSLVHRDVSPQNVFVTYDGQVKILDFGIAKVASCSRNTATGIVKGKIAYMAPEQIVGDVVDRRADVFSVGCMLWAVATGKKLWKDVPDVHIMRRVIQGEIPTPETVNPQCDEELSRIVMKALAPDRNQRYPTALALQADLERYAERFGGAVKQRDVGKLVSQLFAEKRAELKALTERQLSLLANDDTSGSGPIGTANFGFTEPTSSGSGSQLSQQIGVTVGTGTGMLAAPPRRWPLVLLFLVPVSAAALFLVYKANQQPPPAPVVAAPPKVEAPPASAPPAAPTVVTVAFRATPPEAVISVDGQPLPSNPTSKVFPIDGQVHRVEVTAPGHNSIVREFTPTRDDRMDVTLRPVSEPVAAKPTHRRAAPSRAAAAAAPAEKPAEKAKSCSEPFYVDSAGIKRIRPECM